MANGHDYIIKFGADTTGVIKEILSMYKDIELISGKHSDSIVNSKELLNNISGVFAKIKSDIIGKNRINLSDLINIGDLASGLKGADSSIQRFQQRINGIVKAVHGLEIIDGDNIKKLLFPITEIFDDMSSELNHKVKEVEQLSKKLSKSLKEKTDYDVAIRKAYSKATAEGISDVEKENAEKVIQAILKSYVDAFKQQKGFNIQDLLFSAKDKKDFTTKDKLQQEFFTKYLQNIYADMKSSEIVLKEVEKVQSEFSKAFDGYEIVDLQN